MSKDVNENLNTVSFGTVQLIIDYIEMSIHESLTLNQIAKKFYLSVSTLNNLFKIVCGMTIMEYVRNRRLSLAGKELLVSNIHIIELAFKYGYETPEAFTKAFTRFHGFPPSFVRRTYPKIKTFNPLFIKIERFGGWEEPYPGNETLETKLNTSEQDLSSFYCYDKTTKNKGGITMEKERRGYQLRARDMEYKGDWRILLLLAQSLKQKGISFKVDGKTSIFAHGLEFKLDKIGLTFKWKEEQLIKDFFHHKGNAVNSFAGFKYFDTAFEGMKVRCMFYGDCPGDDTDEFLYNNTDSVEVDDKILRVQTLEFYYENAEPDNEYYRMVEAWLKQK
jgi:AraC-like DNA-binding protein